MSAENNKEKSKYPSLNARKGKKYRMEVPIAGVPEEVEIDDVPIDDIVLDEENPRIGYWRDNILRVTDATSQGDLELALKSGNIDEYNRLKRSIEAGGGATEMIWVMKRGEKYVCIDALSGTEGSGTSIIFMLTSRRHLI